MSNSSTRCAKCKGQKKYAGLGGIFKDCEVCNATGKVDIETKAKKPKEAVKKEEIRAPKIESISAEEMFKELGVPDDVIDASLGKSKAAYKEPIFPGYSDELITAILDEPRMEALAWENKYKHVKELFGINVLTQKPDQLMTKVQRAGVRAAYGAHVAQMNAPRAVDLSFAQNEAAKTDALHIAFEQREKSRIEKEAAKA
jgi:hypothetical protein